MISNIKSSIEKILYERAVSPLYGAFFVSWLIWNWQILYLTLFISENQLVITKIDYILKYLFDYNNLIIYPVISTIAIIVIFPFISNGAYYLSQYFYNVRLQIKNNSVSNFLKQEYTQLCDVVHGRHSTLTKQNSLKIKYSKNEFKNFETHFLTIASIIANMYILRFDDLSNPAVKNLAKRLRLLKL